MTDPRIYHAAKACRRTFAEARKYPELMRDEWAERCCADFNLWAASEGVFAPQKASLDERLLLEPQAKEMAAKLVQMLEILVHVSMEKATESRNLIMQRVVHDEIGEDNIEPLDPTVLQALADVENVLDQLVRLTHTIRRAGTRSRLQKADISFRRRLPDLLPFRRHLELVLLARPSEHGTPIVPQSGNPDDRVKVQVLGSSDLNPLEDGPMITAIQTRLIEANLRRRNRFLYAQSHSRKLAVERSKQPKEQFNELVKEEYSQQPKEHHGEEHDGETIAPESVNHTSHNPEETSVRAEELKSTTTATQLDGPLVLPPMQQEEPTMTAISSTGLQIKYPNPPLIAKGDAGFRCPCCCQYLPVKFSRDNKWRKHLATDIMPYTCVLAACPFPEDLFVSREGWERHMERDHKSTSEWTCHACSEPQGNAVFHTKEDFTSHLKQAHRETIKSQQISMLSSLWSRKIATKIESCPICGFHEQRQPDTLDHIAKHIHAFSLRSLPWGPNDYDSHIQDYDNYFRSNPYFAERSEGSVSGDEGTSSSDGERMKALPTLDDSQTLETEEIPLNMSMTEGHLSKVPELFIGAEDVARWMADSSPVTSGVAGVISLGLTICQGLIAYYGPFSVFDSETKSLVGRVSELKYTIEALASKIPTLQDPQSADLTTDVRTAMARISNCEVGLQELSQAFDKCRRYDTPEKVQEEKEWHLTRRALYPFRQETLLDLVRIVSNLQSNLDAAKVIVHLVRGDAWEEVSENIERLEGHTTAQPQERDSDKHKASKELIEAAKSGREKDVAYLVSQEGVDPDYKDDKGCTPLLHAVSKSHEKVVRLLLSTGKVNVNIKTDEIGTPLTSAARYGNLPIVQLLIDNGAEVNLPDSSLRTPLARAAARGNNEVAKLLLEKGADIGSSALASRTPLLNAAKYGRIKTVELLLDTGADITGTSASGKTALARAAAYGHEDVVKMLVERDANVDFNKTERLTTALIEAIKNGRSSIVHLLLIMGADIALCGGPKKMTPLEYAVHYEDEVIVKLLLDRCAPFDLYQETINSALVRAIGHNNFKNVQCVLLAASTNADKISWTNALEHAAARGHESVLKLVLDTYIHHMTKGNFHEAIDEPQQLLMRRQLLEQGADFRFPEHRGRIPLLYAASRGYVSIVKASLEQGVDSKDMIHEALVGATRTGQTHIVQFLLNEGVDVNARINNLRGPIQDQSLLHLAVKAEQVEIAKLLLESGADINGGKEDSHIPLHAAIRHKHSEIAQLLISHKADVNIQNKNGLTALHIASKTGYDEMVQLLLESGADTSKQNERKKTPLYLATERNHAKVVQLLIGRGARVDTPNYEGITPFHAATNSSKGIALLFLEQAKNTELHHKARPVALSLAAREGQCDTIQAILDQGEDVNVKDWKGRTALFWAANSGYTNAVQLLLNREADPNCQPTSGQTILAVAAKKGQSEIVKLLLEKGADPNAKDQGKRYKEDEEGTTPLYWAVMNGHGSVARLLLDHGADANHRDRSWGSVVQVARRSGHTDLVDLLEQYGAR